MQDTNNRRRWSWSICRSQKVCERERATKQNFWKGCHSCICAQRVFFLPPKDCHSHGDNLFTMAYAWFVLSSVQDPRRAYPSGPGHRQHLCLVYLCHLPFHHQNTSWQWGFFAKVCSQRQLILSNSRWS